ncbi:TetR/AcrR family transcriptional regulator [Nocardia sp. NPDC003482]
MTETRPLRADARRNRERVLNAAREAFAAEGISVPLDEIARRAGVGPGTVYRHFPTKEALFHAAIVDNLERMIDFAREAARAAEPGPAFFAFLERMVAEGGLKRDLAEALGSHDTVECSAPTQQLWDEIDGLLRRAQDDGAIRADLRPTDLKRIIRGVFLATHSPEITDDERRHTFAIVFDGMRPR